MDAAYLFAKNFINIQYEDLTTEVIEATKREILDLLGIAVGGASHPGVKELLELVLDWGGKEESSIIGMGRKVPAPNAGHVNATMAHALDYDDVHEFAIVHPGVTIIPTCMAIGEQKGRMSGKEFITSTALGVDMMCRLAMATTPGENPIKTGWHLTTLFGFLGAAITAGRVLGFEEEKMVNAMGIAYHQCCGNGQCVKDGAMTKRLGPGFSVKGGITAALMAEKGVTGAKNILEGVEGLYRLYMGGKYDRDTLTAGLGEYFEGVNVGIKPYPCCRGIHPAIDSALELSKENIETDNIQEIRIFVSDAHNYLLCTPFDAKSKPRNPVDAQFSIPWGVATAIARKRVFLEDYKEEAIKSRDILDVASKISVEMDDTLKRSEKVDPTRVEIKTKHGDLYSKQVEDALGSLQRPMSFGDCARKFRDCTKVLNEAKVNSVIELVEVLETVDDIGEIISMLSME